MSPSATTPRGGVVDGGAAERPKDLEFCAALKRAGLVRVAVLEERLPSIVLDERLRALVAARIRGL